MRSRIMNQRTRSRSERMVQCLVPRRRQHWSRESARIVRSLEPQFFDIWTCPVLPLGFLPVNHDLNVRCKISVCRRTRTGTLARVNTQRLSYKCDCKRNRALLFSVKFILVGGYRGILSGLSFMKMNLTLFLLAFSMFWKCKWYTEYCFNNIESNIHKASLSFILLVKGAKDIFIFRESEK